MTRRPRLLDLFSGAGGAAVGYARAGFDVVGIDHRPQPRYPFPFLQGDAFQALEEYGLGFDAIHASPPCQAHSILGRVRWSRREHQDHLEETRTRLLETGLPFVIENVPHSPLQHQLVLCGSMFGLGADCQDGVRRQLRRHRLFESNVAMMSPPCWHHQPSIGVHGGGPVVRLRTGAPRGGHQGSTDDCRQAMGIDWMIRSELVNAIPPAYTEHIGGYLLAHLARDAA